MAKNLCGKRRDKDNPYEIWVIPHTEWEFRVLKKYQSPENEAKNQYARWYMATKSPYTYGAFELGDGYAREVKQHAVKIFPE